MHGARTAAFGRKLYILLKSSNKAWLQAAVSLLLTAIKKVSARLSMDGDGILDHPLVDTAVNASDLASAEFDDSAVE